jgi:hypothetical protein
MVGHSREPVSLFRRSVPQHHTNALRFLLPIQLAVTSLGHAVTHPDPPPRHERFFPPPRHERFFGWLMVAPALARASESFSAEVCPSIH